MHTILIVDDEEHIRFILSELLRKEGYKTILAENGNKAIRSIQNEKPDLVLLDYKLPDINGIEVLKKIQELELSIIVIMITAYGDIKDAVTSMKLGAYDYLTKPFNNDDILMIVEKSLKTLQMSREAGNFYRKISADESIKEMMGESKEIRKVLSQVELVADSDITVFLEGETGTGKDLIAKMIHHKSRRKNKQFIAVDCGAIPETLFESEMFGHEKGAFTGANNQMIGKFEMANGGTLFLDEICNLPMNMQSKLLRVIQDKTIQRLGGKKIMNIDVRLIAACNNNIVEEIKISKFRKDLFYRINEFSIILPNLSKRKDDIPIIAEYFLKEMSRDYNRSVTSFSQKAINALQEYSWSGNIRELKNVIKRAVLLAKSEIILPKDLVFRKLDEIEKKEEVSEEFLIDKATREAKKNIIMNALKKTGGNKTEAAKILGISRRQLYWDLEKLEIT